MEIKEVEIISNIIILNFENFSFNIIKIEIFIIIQVVEIKIYHNYH